ncbi:MAG: TlpA family protein disulfide reductase [Methanobrevibacter sp.]|nr:TlpA family protein disulfide reductase [Methanobrevibacter sp.]
MVNFWVTWCPSCRAEIPDFQKLYKNKDVEILAVNLTSTEERKEGAKNQVALVITKKWDMRLTKYLAGYIV